MPFRAQPGAYHRKYQALAEASKQRDVTVRRVETFAIPDLLHQEAFLAVNGEALLELLGLGFLGKDLGGSLDKALATADVGDQSWKPEFFAKDLFVEEFARSCSLLKIEGVTYRANRLFLARTLSSVPTDLATIELRQGILREIEGDPEIYRCFHDLYKSLYTLLSLFETPGYQGSLDTTPIHLEILKHSKKIIDGMAENFGSATSGLKRLHDAAVQNQATKEYETLSALLEYEGGMANLALDVRVGGDGRIRSVHVQAIEENGNNPFHLPTWKRLRHRLRLLAGGYDFTNKELMKRLVNQVFDQLSPSLIPLIQLLGHLEFYLCSLEFKSRAEERDLEVSLIAFDNGATVELKELFNPLLLQQADPPVPCSFTTARADAITLVTGPNSGGKTRLLQALGWAQLLGQSGVYAPVASARLPLLNGLFVSLVENESADQIEGRLGRELMRIRSLFDEIRPRSGVILDEFCSGTNPSEGVEVFSLVLKLLRQVRPTAFVTTHFLDFARCLQDEPPIGGLEFLRVELDAEQLSTYQFVEGVAPTSLAALTATRLGVTFERLSSLLARHSTEPPSVEDEIDETS